MLGTVAISHSQAFYELTSWCDAATWSKLLYSPALRPMLYYTNPTKATFTFVETNDLLKVTKLVLVMGTSCPSISD